MAEFPGAGLHDDHVRLLRGGIRGHVLRVHHPGVRSLPGILSAMARRDTERPEHSPGARPA